MSNMMETFGTTAPSKESSYAPRLGIDIAGRGVTSAPIAILQLIDGHGQTGEQIDRYEKMRRPLYEKFLRENPDIAEKLMSGEIKRPKDYSTYNQTDRRMLSEDLNSVQIKFNNWKKANIGQELTPQERVTQSFVDVRNPNSRW